MADDIVIRAEELSKKYVIGHEAQRERYVALRDVIARSARNAWRMAKDMAKGRVVVPGDTVEEFWALKDVDFEVKRGEVLGIIGRNGAGKSTLLKVLSRITEPSEGRVTIKGRVASLLEVGTGFHPELTGRENIYLNGAVLGMTRAEIKRKFDEIVAFADVERFLDTPVKRYSSGMYVRLAFAVAAHLEPEILVVDEVLSVGDAEFQKKCIGKMQDVAGHGRTVLFVSHSMGAITKLCHRAILLASGKIEAVGRTEAVIEHYLSGSERSYSAHFPSAVDRPSITNVTVDHEALKVGDLAVEIAFESPWPIQTPVGGIVIRALNGQVLWGSNGRFHPRTNDREDIAEGILRCSAKGIPLWPGEYVLSVWLGDWHEDHDAKIDVVTIQLGSDSNIPMRPSTSAIGHLSWSATWSVAQVPISQPQLCKSSTALG